MPLYGNLIPAPQLSDLQFLLCYALARSLFYMETTPASFPLWFTFCSHTANHCEQGDNVRVSVKFTETKSTNEQKHFTGSSVVCWVISPECVFQPVLFRFLANSSHTQCLITINLQLNLTTEIKNLKDKFHFGKN